MIKIKVARKKIKDRYDKNQGGLKKLNKGITKIKVGKKKIKHSYNKIKLD